MIDVRPRICDAIRMSQSGLSVVADEASPPTLTTPAIIAGNVRKLRDAKGLTQAFCARRLGVAPTTWSCWELQTAPVPTAQLDGIARILDVAVVTLVTVEL